MSTPSPAPVAAAGRDAPAATTWVAAAAGVAWLPADVATYDVPVARAAAHLRVDEEVVRTLVDEALPSAPGPDREPCVDAHDLFNLALDVGWRRAMPVVGFRGAMRWLGGSPERLVDRVAWRAEIGPPSDHAGEPVHAALPVPERFGGRWRDEDGERDAPAEPDGVPRVALRAGELLRGVATVAGARSPVRAPEIREAVAEVVGSGARWAKLPMALQRRPERVTAMGYATCVSVSAELRERLTRRGFEVTAHRGWLMSTLPAAHSWLEVRDEDGEVKVVDPVLVLLRRRLAALEAAIAARGGAPAGDGFEWLADGLLVNRVLPTAASAADDLGVTPAGAPAPLVATFRPVPERP